MTPSTGIQCWLDVPGWTLTVYTRSFMLKAESVLPPYQFGVYDVLVLPPSFPYGGMVRYIENGALLDAECAYRRKTHA